MEVAHQGAPDTFGQRPPSELPSATLMAKGCENEADMKAQRRQAKHWLELKGMV